MRFDPVAAYIANQLDLRTSETSFISTYSVNASLILYWLGFVTVVSWLAIYIYIYPSEKLCKRLLLVFFRNKKEAIF